MIDSAAAPPGLAALADAAGLPKFRFYRLFRAITGLTPKQYAAARQSEALRAALRESGSVTEAVYEAGFSSSSRFYAAAPSALGMVPQNFRAGGRGERLRVAIGACRLGALLVAASETGICAIALGDDPAALLRGFQDDFRAAEIIAGDQKFEALVARVAGLMETPSSPHELPLDLRGTAFQRLVWAALREIPPGATISYGALAARLGMPKAVRAVAAACAANRLAVAVPCHRVVASTGALTGYRWGIGRKEILLAREAGLG